MEQRGFVDAFWMKMFMAVLMVLDHIYYFFPRTTPLWFNILGRLVAPTFTFLMTQGLIHTRDRFRYFLRLLFWGLCMLTGNLLLQTLFGRRLVLDIFLSLAVSAAIILSIEELREGFSPKWLLLLGAGLVAMFFVEGGILLPVMAMIFYFLRHDTKLMCAAYVGIMAVVVSVLHGFPHRQLWMLLAVVPILLYNGKRGFEGAFAKYFFYLFYPLHVWALYLVRALGS